MRRLIVVCVILLTISFVFAEEIVEMDVPDYRVYVGETEMVDAKYPLLNYRHMVYLPLSFDLLDFLGYTIEIKEDVVYLYAVNQSENYKQTSTHSYDEEVYGQTVNYDFVVKNVPLDNNYTYPVIRFENVLYIPMNQSFVEGLGVDIVWGTDDAIYISNDYVPERTVAASEEVKSEAQIKSLAESVVKLYVETEEAIFSGSGFFVTPKRIMTNYHVIEGAQNIKIKYDDETLYTDEVRVVDFSEQQDMAILEIDADKKPLGIGFTGRILEGDDIYTISSPKGVLNVMTSGRVIDFDKDTIDFSAIIDSGSSGGPLFDIYGKVVGLIYKKYTGAFTYGIAISMDTVKDLTDNKQWTLDEFRANTGYKGTPQWVDAKLYDDRSVKITWQNTGADYYTFYITGYNQAHSYNTTLLNAYKRPVVSIDGHDGIEIEDLMLETDYSVYVIPHYEGETGKISEPVEFRSQDFVSDKLTYDLYNDYQKIATLDHSFLVDHIEAVIDDAGYVNVSMYIAGYQIDSVLNMIEKEKNIMRMVVMQIVQKVKKETGLPVSLTFQHTGVLDAINQKHKDWVTSTVYQNDSKLYLNVKLIQYSDSNPDAIQLLIQ